MCGRFTREYSWAEIRAFLDLRWPAEMALHPSWNVAPTQAAPVARVRPGADDRELCSMRWGFEVPGVERPVINARAETLRTRPSFRDAVEVRRCVVPASGFYEWERDGTGRAHPYYIHAPEGRGPYLFAGLWAHGAATGTPDTFVIITTPPNRAVGAIHDRMPAILSREAIGEWLDPVVGGARAADLLAPAPDDATLMRRVSRRVNRVAHDDRDLTAPAAPPSQGTLFGG